MKMVPSSASGALDARTALPLLIDGADGSGASLFSMCVLATLARSGEQLLVCTEKPNALDAFQEQAGWSTGDPRLLSPTTIDGIQGSGTQVLWLPSAAVGLLEAAIEAGAHANRVVFLKNCETLLTPRLEGLLAAIPRRIVTGDCGHPNASLIRILDWSTVVRFDGNPPRVGHATGTWDGEVALVERE